MPTTVNAIGDACPIPVVKTIQAIKALNGKGSIETHVDNEIAVQNVTKLAENKGFAVSNEKLDDKHYVIQRR